jgi:curved DNA-binding protein CbpA
VNERRRDPYAILGVQRSALREDIGRAYRARAKRAHPDIGGQPSSEMGLLNWAWHVLSDPARRAEWDRDHPTQRSPRHWAEPGQPGRAAPGASEGRYANPAWTVSGEPWAGAGAPAVDQRASIGCLGVGLLMVMLSAFVLLGGFLSGYQSAGGEPAEASESNAGN